MHKKSKSISLSLSGGALRVAAHIGVIRFLKEKDIDISAVSGSSAGAMIALLLASGVEYTKMEEFIKSLKRRDLMKFTSNSGIFHLGGIKSKLLDRFKDNLLYQNIPCYVAVTNILNGEVEYLNSGDMVENTIASSSLIPLFTPVRLNGKLYADGGLKDNLPVKPLLRYNNPILGIDLNPLPQSEPNSFWNLSLHTIMLVLQNSTIPSKELSNYTLSIDGIETMHLFDFSMIDKAIEMGYESISNSWFQIERTLFSN